jgi:hypothetical protein
VSKEPGREVHERGTPKGIDWGKGKDPKVVIIFPDGSIKKREDVPGG